MDVKVKKFVNFSIFVNIPIYGIFSRSYGIPMNRDLKKSKDFLRLTSTVSEGKKVAKWEMRDNRNDLIETTIGSVFAARVHSFS